MEVAKRNKLVENWPQIERESVQICVQTSSSPRRGQFSVRALENDIAESLLDGLLIRIQCGRELTEWVCLNDFGNILWCKGVTQQRITVSLIESLYLVNN